VVVLVVIAVVVAAVVLDHRGGHGEGSRGSGAGRGGRVLVLLCDVVLLFGFGVCRV
jgi:uncharacterized membrane protein YdcZ (DUF606 family)